MMLADSEDDGLLGAWAPPRFPMRFAPAVARAAVAAAPNFTAAAAAASSALSGQSPTVNPYPNGISVAGTGPNNSATTWQTGFHTDWGVWVCNTGFGVAPIFRDGEMARFVDFSAQRGWEGSGIVSYVLKGAPREQFLRRLDGSGESADGMPGLLHFLVILDQAGNPHGGQQRVWYRKDWLTGYWIPNNAQGVGAKGSNLFKELVIAAVIIVAVVVTYGAATGAIGAGAAAGGAAAGGSAAATGAAAAGAGLTAGTVATYAGYASTALSLGQKVQQLTGGKRSAGGQQTVMVQAPAAASASGQVVAAGTQLIAPDGSTVTTQSAGSIPAGYVVAQAPGAGTFVPQGVVRSGTVLISPSGQPVTTSSPGTIPAGYSLPMPSGSDGGASPGADEYNPVSTPLPGRAGAPGALAGLPAWVTPAAIGAGALLLALFLKR